MITAPLRFLRAHALPAVSLSAAALSFILTPPSMGTLKAIDFKTLNLLFCLMTVLAGLRSCNLFQVLAHTLLGQCATLRGMAHTLVGLTFFLAMLVTNDVALLALVPFSVYVCTLHRQRTHLPVLIILQALAANLGSLVTPIGNPQNLYLYTAQAIPTAAFFAVTVPIALTGCAVLIPLTHRLPTAPLSPQRGIDVRITHPKRAIACGILFGLCLLSVFRLLPGLWLFAAVTGTALVGFPKILRKVDCGLLGTFVGFFVFSYNIGCWPPLEETLSALCDQAPMATAILTSQVLSNVPAAILLSPFTDNWAHLLLGVDIGGFGTPIASLASLIALNLWFREPESRPLHMLGLFLLHNLLMLFVLLGACAILFGKH